MKSKSLVTNRLHHPLPRSSLRILFIMFSFLLTLFASSLLLVNASHTYYEVKSIPSSSTVSSYLFYSDNDDCSGRTHMGIKSEGNVQVRTKAINDKIITVNNLITSSKIVKIGGEDTKVENSFSYGDSLGVGESEVFSIGATAENFAYVNWDSGQPQGSTGEQCLCYISKSTPWHDVPCNYGSFRNWICGFSIAGEHTASTLSVTSGNKATGYGLYEGTPFVRYEVYREHLTQAAAFRACESMKRYDPSRNEMISGELAMVYHSFEYAALKEAIENKGCDALYHSSSTGYGIWLGLNTSGGELYWRQTMYATRTLRMVLADGSCGPIVSCKKDPSCLLTANRGGVYLRSSSKIATLSNTVRVPFACSWHFAPNASRISSSDACISQDLTKTVSNAEIVTFRLYTLWLDRDEAQAACEATTATNRAGDVSSGMLAVVLKNEEYTAINKLMTASKYFASSNGISDSTYIGWNIGASTKQSWGLDDKSQFKAKIYWNRGGKMPYGNTSMTWSPKVFEYRSGNLQCNYHCSCGSVTVKDKDNQGTSQGVAVRGGNSASWYTMSSSRRRGYLCSYHFPARRQVLSWYVVEYHAVILSHARATEFCTGRRVGSSGKPLNNSRMGEIPEKARGRVEKFLSDETGTTGAVFTGPRGANNKCQVWHRQAEKYAWLDCTYELPFLCHFISATPSSSPSETHTKPRTESDSISETVTPTKTISLVDRWRTLTNSSSETESISASESDTFTRSKTANTRSHSPSVSESPSVSASPSESNSSSETLSVKTPSHSTTRTETVTSSLSQTPSAPSESNSKSAAGGDAATFSHTSTHDSRSVTSSNEVSETHPTYSLTKETNTLGFDSHTHTRSEGFLTHSETETFNTWKPYQKPALIQELQTITGFASVVSGGGVIAVQKSRLDAADGLSRCGEPGQFEEEPDTLSSPFGFKFGSREDEKPWARGTVVGNVLTVIVSGICITILAAVVGIVWKRSFRKGIKHGIDFFRIPGILVVPLAVLESPSAEAAATLLVHTTANTATARLLGLGSLFIMVGLGLAVVVQVGRIVQSGLLVIRSIPPSEAGFVVKKLEGSHCGRLFVRCCSYLFTSETGWVPHVSLNEYLDLVSGKEEKAQDEKKKRTNAERFLIGFGAVFEDFTLAHFSALDLVVSIVLGWCAGVASGELSKTACLVWLSIALTATAAHTFVLMYYKPCLVRATQWFMTIGSLFTTASVGLSIAQFVGRDVGSTSVVEKVMLAQSFMGVLLMFISFGFGCMILIEFVDACVTHQDLEALQEDTQNRLRLYADTYQEQDDDLAEGVGAIRRRGDNNNNNNGKGVANRKRTASFVGGGGKKRRKANNAFEEELALVREQLHPDNEEAPLPNQQQQQKMEDQEMDDAVALLGSQAKANMVAAKQQQQQQNVKSVASTTNSPQGEELAHRRAGEEGEVNKSKTFAVSIQPSSSSSSSSKQQEQQEEGEDNYHFNEEDYFSDDDDDDEEEDDDLLDAEVDDILAQI